MATTVKGDKQLVKKLKGLPDKIEKKVCRQALRKGAKIEQKKVKELVPVKSGATKKAVKVRSMKRKKGRVGVSVTLSQSGFSEAFYANFPELGTKYQPAQHNILKAAEQTQEQASEVIITDLKTGIEKAAAI